MLEALQGYGASVRAASSADDALDALSEFDPALVLSDIAMPGRDRCSRSRAGCVRSKQLSSTSRASRGGDSLTRTLTTASARSLQASMTIWPNLLIPQRLHLQVAACSRLLPDHDKDESARLCAPTAYHARRVEPIDSVIVHAFAHGRA